MIILGVDPGIGRAGWGIVETENSKLKTRNFGCIETEANSPLVERLLILHQRLDEIIAEYKPDVMAVEELFFNTNAKTALIVGHARGVIMLSAGIKNIPVTSYTPLQVKMALTGYGRAEKNQIGLMVKTMLHLQTIPKPDDTADALAIALTHAFSYKLKALKKG